MLFIKRSFKICRFCRKSTKICEFCGKIVEKIQISFKDPQKNANFIKMIAEITIISSNKCKKGQNFIKRSPKISKYLVKRLWEKIKNKSAKILQDRCKFCQKIV